MPTSTYKSFLMHKETGGTYKMLFPVKTIPALGAAPSTLDTTTLSDSMKTGIPDILDLGTLEFSTNYEKEYYEKLLALKGKEEGWAVWFGGTESGGVLTPTGSEGKWEFTGQVVAYPGEQQVSAVRELNFAIYPSSPVEYVEG